MSQIRVISLQDTVNILDIKSVIEVVENAYVLKSKKNAELFPMVFHDFAPVLGDMDIKSGCITESGIFGLKLVSWFSNNSQQGLPQLFGTVMILDCKTGQPLGILNGEHITGMRTGAAGAIGAKYLANPDSEKLLIIGTGHQAKYQIAATLITLGNIKRVMVYNPHSIERAVNYVQNIKPILNNEFLSKYEKGSKLYEKIADKFDVDFEAVTDLSTAVGKSDIIITVTPSRTPIIRKEWITKGIHFSCVGSDMSGKQEIDETIFENAKIVVDDIEQAISVGEIEVAINKGIISKQNIMGEIGSAICGNLKARTSEDDITIYDSTGIALQDLICAKLVLDIAEEKNIGTIAEL